MKILNDEQLAYLKNLESPKKRRKFMLDCLVKNVLGESAKSVKISELPYVIFKDGKLVVEKDTPMCDFLMSQCSTTAPKTFQGIMNNEQFQLPSDVIQRSVDLGLKGLRAINEAYETAEKLKNDESAKSNYTPEEVDMAKNLMTEREKFVDNIKKIDENKYTEEDMFKMYLNGIVDTQTFLVTTKNCTWSFQERLKNIKNE
jgi:hypothetical protein